MTPNSVILFCSLVLFMYIFFLICFLHNKENNKILEENNKILEEINRCRLENDIIISNLKIGDKLDLSLYKFYNISTEIDQFGTTYILKGKLLYDPQYFKDKCLEVLINTYNFIDQSNSYNITHIYKNNLLSKILY